MSDYKIDQDGTIIFNNNDRNIEKTEMDALYKEYSLLEYEVLNNHGNPTKDPKKLARYKELKNLLKIDDIAQGKAILEAKQEILDRIGKTDDKAKILAAWKEQQNG